MGGCLKLGCLATIAFFGILLVGVWFSDHHSAPIDSQKIAAPSQSESRQREIYLAVLHAHKEAMRLADRAFPQLSPIPQMTPEYRAQALKNSARYDAEFSRLIAPATIKYKMTEDQLTDIFTDYSVKMHKRP